MIGLVYRGRGADVRGWSGIPAGLARGFAELGLETAIVNAEPPRVLNRTLEAWALLVHRHRFGGMYAAEVRAVRRLVARTRGRRVGALRGVVQMGSDFGTPFPGFVTYEDMTVRQFARVFALEELLGQAAVERWAAAQAAVYEAASACCVASTWAAESLAADYGVDPERIQVVGIGRNHDPRPVPRDWGLPSFLFVGQDWERKNGPLLLRAFARVRAAVSSAQLHVVGDHPPIELDGVVGHGRLDSADAHDRAQVNRLFETATCFVMPSLFEPFGMTYIEAAAAGVPSIATAIGGARDLVGADAGIVVEPTDEEALVRAMLDLSEGERARQLGATARTRAERFTWSGVAERIAALLELDRAER